MIDGVPNQQRHGPVRRARDVLYTMRPRLVFRRALGWRDGLVSRRDMRRLRREEPEIARAASPQDLAAERSALAGAYERYVHDVSTENMAISLELATFMLGICRALRPRRVLDLGSGFSSYVLRLYAQQSDTGVRVVSVDDSDEWLPKTRGFVERYGLSTSNMVPWRAFLEDGEKDFDLILHDLGGLPLRGRVLPEVLGLARPGGVLLFDDANHPVYRSLVRDALSADGLRAYNLRAITKDGIRRYSLLARR